MSSSSQLSSSCLLSPSERLYILQGCHDNCRLDGRRVDECRQYHQLATTTDRINRSHNNSNDSSVLLPLCNGSARVFTIDHATDILATVKAELVRPAPQTPTRGNLELSIDHAPTGVMRHSQQRSFCDQLQSLLSHLFLPYCMDLSSLCLVPGMYVWRLQIDIWIVSSSGGSMVDACSRVLRAALMDTLLPHVELLSSSSSGASQSSSSKSSKLQDTAPNTTTNPTAAGTVDWIVDGDIAHAHRLEALVRAHAPCVMTISVLPAPPSMKTTSSNSTSTNQVSLVLDTTLQEEACATCQVHVAIDPEGAICATTMTTTTTATATSNTQGSSLLSLGMLQEITDITVSHGMDFHQKTQHVHKQEPMMQQQQQQPQQFSLLQSYFIIQ